MNEAKINHAVAELLTHDELLAYRKGCNFAATLRKMLAEEAPVPVPASVQADPHAELRKTWREGQRWQWGERGVEWRTLSGKPGWIRSYQYRRHPDDLPAADAGGWIAHDGGECPVEPDVLVDIRLRCGEVLNRCLASTLFWYWHRQNSNSRNITNYRRA